MKNYDSIQFSSIFSIAFWLESTANGSKYRNEAKIMFHLHQRQTHTHTHTIRQQVHTYRLQVGIVIIFMFCNHQLCNRGFFTFISLNLIKSTCSKCSLTFYVLMNLNDLQTCLWLIFLLFLLCFACSFKVVYCVGFGSAIGHFLLSSNKSVFVWFVIHVNDQH